MFCKLEQFRYSRGGTGTSHSTSSRSFDVMYLTLAVPDSCHDTVEILIVVLLVLLHFFFLATYMKLGAQTFCDIKISVSYICVHSLLNSDAEPKDGYELNLNFIYINPDQITKVWD